MFPTKKHEGRFNHEGRKVTKDTKILAAKLKRLVILVSFVAEPFFVIFVSTPDGQIRQDAHIVETFDVSNGVGQAFAL